MNIFKESEGFLRNETLESFFSQGEDFFPVMRSLRERLGNKRYLLYNYVEVILEATIQQTAYAYAEEGFTAFVELRRICTNILDGSSSKKHPIYPIVKEVIEKYQHTYQERETLRSLASAAVFQEFKKFQARKFLKNKTTELDAIIDSVKQQELFSNITQIIGEHEMELLNTSLKQTFFFVPAIEAYLQGMTIDYVYCLAYRDPETEKLIFQILLEDTLEE